MEFSKIPLKYLNIPDGTANGMVLRYNQTSDTWEPVQYLLEYLDDIVLTNLLDKHILVYNSSISKWENKSVHDAGIVGDNLGDHTATEDLKMAGFKVINMLDGTDLQDGVTFSQFDGHTHAIGDIIDLQNQLDDITNSLNNQLLSDHIDVNFSGLILNDIIIYNNILSKWVNKNIYDVTTVVGNSAYSDIDMQSHKVTNMADGVDLEDGVTKSQLDAVDTDLHNLLTNQTLNDHSDVDVTTPQDLSFLVYNIGTYKWEAKTAAQLSITGDNLGDHTATEDLEMSNFNIINLRDGVNDNDAVNKGQMDVLFTSIQDTINNQILGDHTDVTISNPTDLQFLQYNSSTNQWENVTISLGDNLGNHTATEDLKMSGFKVVNMADGVDLQDGVSKSQFDSVNNALTNQVLNDHTDVDISSPINEQLLKYNSATSKWENKTVSIPQGDNLGNHTATQDLNMNDFKVTGVADGVNSQDGVNKNQLDNYISVLNNNINNQVLNDHIDVNLSTLSNLDILQYNNTSQKWENVSSDSLKDNLGNHIATQDLNMSGFNVVDVANGVNDNDAVNKFQLDNHTHTWNDVSKIGSLLTDIDNIDNSLVKANGYFLTWDATASNWNTKQPVRVSSSEPGNTFVGVQWQVKNASGNLHTRYESRLLTLVDTSASGGLNNTWYTCDGELVNILIVPSGYASGGKVTSGTSSTTDKFSFLSSTGNASYRSALTASRYLPASVFSSSNAYISGGYDNNGSVHNNIDNLDFTSDTSNIITRGTMSLNRAAHGNSVYKSANKGFFISGANSSTSTTTSCEYIDISTTTGNGISSANMPIAIHTFASAYDSKIGLYCVGEIYTNPGNTSNGNHFVHDFANDTFNNYDLSLQVDNGPKAIFDANNVWYPAPAAYSYHILKTSFASPNGINDTGVTLNIQRGYMATMNDGNNYGYFTGGFDGTSNYFDTVERFEYSTQVLNVLTGTLVTARGKLAGSSST